jgi:hypothetical protein
VHRRGDGTSPIISRNRCVVLKFSCTDEYRQHVQGEECTTKNEISDRVVRKVRGHLASVNEESASDLLRFPLPRAPLNLLLSYAIFHQRSVSTLQTTPVYCTTHPNSLSHAGDQMRCFEG